MACICREGSVLVDYAIIYNRPITTSDEIEAINLIIEKSPDNPVNIVGTNYPVQVLLQDGGNF